MTALKHVDSVFIVTPGGTENRGEIALGAAKACKRAGVKFVVLLSVTAADHQDTIFGR